MMKSVKISHHRDRWCVRCVIIVTNKAYRFHFFPFSLHSSSKFLGVDRINKMLIMINNVCCWWYEILNRLSISLSHDGLILQFYGWLFDENHFKSTFFNEADRIGQHFYGKKVHRCNFLLDKSATIFFSICFLSVYFIACYCKALYKLSYYCKCIWMGHTIPMLCTLPEKKE